MLKKGDHINICAFCLKVLSHEQAEVERVRGVACRKGGHVMVLAVCEESPSGTV